MIIILLIICFICTLTYTFVTMQHFFQVRTITGFLVCAAMYDFVYGIFPLWIFFQIIIENGSIISIIRMLDLSQEGVIALAFHYLYAFSGFIVICLTYYGSIGRVKIEHRCVSNHTTLDQATYFAAWTCLAIGAVSMFLWSYAYGSIFQLIQQANRVRSGYGLVSNGLAFFKHPTKVVLLSSYLFFAICTKIEKNKPLTAKKILNYIGLSCSLVLSYLYLMANDGRLTIVLFVVGLFWLYFSSGRKIKRPGKSLAIFVLLSAIALALLIKMDDITYFLRYGNFPIRTSNTSISSSVAKELLFLPLGGQTSILSVWSGKAPLTVFDDLVTGIFAWFPSSLKPHGFEDVWNINTKLIYGDLSVLHGQAPCGIVTQGYYDARFVGVLFICIALGLSLKKFDRIDQSNWSIMRYAIGADIFLMLIRCVPYFSLYDIVLGLFPIIIMVLVYQMWRSILYTIKKRR